MKIYLLERSSCWSVVFTFNDSEIAIPPSFPILFTIILIISSINQII